MTIQDILQRCSHLEIEGSNDISEDFVERVFFRKDIEQWEKEITDILGPPVKRAGEKTTKLFSDLTINYGGILKDQVLFYKKYDDQSVIVMFWPWKDNNQVTLKIACFKE